MALDPSDRRRLEVELCGLPSSTPPVLLSGCVGFGEEYTRVEGFSNRDAGAVRDPDCPVVSGADSGSAASRFPEIPRNESWVGDTGSQEPGPPKLFGRMDFPGREAMQVRSTSEKSPLGGCRRMLMGPREFSLSDREAVYRVQAGEFTHWTFHR